LALIQRYAQVAIREATTIIEGDQVAERKEVCDLLRQEIDQEVKFYDAELQQLQTRRASIWDTHADLLGYLVTQEKLRNEKLDTLYQSHSAVLEKIYPRHNENTEHIALKSIEAGNESFKFLTAPLQLLLGFFGASKDVSPKKAAEEAASRKDVADVEKDINGEAESQEKSPNKKSSVPEESFSDLSI